jgi:hypothetical protein
LNPIWPCRPFVTGRRAPVWARCLEPRGEKFFDAYPMLHWEAMSGTSRRFLGDSGCCEHQADRSRRSRASAPRALESHSTRGLWKLCTLHCECSPLNAAMVVGHHCSIIEAEPGSNSSRRINKSCVSSWRLHFSTSSSVPPNLSSLLARTSSTDASKCQRGLSRGYGRRDFKAPSEGKLI